MSKFTEPCDHGVINECEIIDGIKHTHVKCVLCGYEMQVENLINQRDHYKSRCKELFRELNHIKSYAVDRWVSEEMLEVCLEELNE